MMTPEQFMSTPQPDEDLDELTPEEVGLVTGLLPILTSIAESVAKLVSSPVVETVVTREDELQQALNQLDAEYAELQVRNGVLAGRLEEIRALVKPSTSKLANAVRDVLDADAVAEDDEGNVDDSLTEPHTFVDTASAMCALCGQPAGKEIHQAQDKFRLGEHPADDAPVEVWREYGRWCGLDLTDNLNRSQIRSALGIPQPVAT